VLIVHVHVQVKPGQIQAFQQATAKNARHSLKEPGILRFDVIQETEHPERFVLVEVYKDQDAPARHKETAHYAEWRDVVADMMAAPRTSFKYSAVFPEAGRWATPGEGAE